MQAKSFKIALALLLLSIIFGGGFYLWKNSRQEKTEIVTEEKEIQTYSNDSFMLEYPKNYHVVADGFGLVTISGSNGQMMIGKDFEPAAGPAPTDDMTQEALDEFPKDIEYHGIKGEVASALFYKTGDEVTANELKSIQDSVQLK